MRLDPVIVRTGSIRGVDTSEDASGKNPQLGQEMKSGRLEKRKRTQKRTTETS